MGGLAIPNINIDPSVLARIQAGTAGLSTAPGSGAVSARDFAPNVPGAGTAFDPATLTASPSIPAETPQYTGIAAEGLTGEPADLYGPPTIE